METDIRAALSRAIRSSVEASIVRATHEKAHFSVDIDVFVRLIAQEGLLICDARKFAAVSVGMYDTRTHATVPRMPDDMSDLIARLRGPLPIEAPRNLLAGLLRPLSEEPPPIDMIKVYRERTEAAVSLEAKNAEIAALRLALGGATYDPKTHAAIAAAESSDDTDTGVA